MPVDGGGQLSEATRVERGDSGNVVCSHILGGGNHNTRVSERSGPTARYDQSQVKRGVKEVGQCDLSSGRELGKLLACLLLCGHCIA